MQSVMSHNFSRVPQAEIQRSSFDRSHGYKTTLNSGYLVPVFLDEALPGDTFNLNMSVFARLATPIKPIMDNLFLDSFFFAVPYRLVWNNFRKFMGEQDNPGDSTDFTTPVIDAATIAANSAVGSLWGNFGLPMKTGKASLDKVSALPFRMYNLIYNDWFRDQDLINSLTVSKGNGPDSLADYAVKRVARFKDYINTARPALS